MKPNKNSEGKSAVRKTFDLKPKKPKKPEDDKNVKLNKEDTTDDILGLLGYTKDSFKDVEKNARSQKKSELKVKKDIKKTRAKKYQPRKIKGKPIKGFAEYLRSEGEVKKVLKEKLGLSKITLDGVIRLFADHKIKIADSVILSYDVKEVNKYREYDRKPNEYGKRTPEEFEELKQDIKKRGIKDWSVLQIDRDKSGNLKVILGEGNHRLAIAKLLGIRKMPLMISYYP